MARWRSRVVVALLIVLAGAYQFWAVRATGERLIWGHDELVEYYDQLGRAFAGGHLYLPTQPSPQLLAQPDPWDPALPSSIKMHDMALFEGHYYLYFGAAPAVLLFTPWRLVTGHDLPERFAAFLLCFGGFLFYCGSLLRVLDLAGARPGLRVLALLLLALAVCQGVPFLLNRVDVYEVAISGGYFCVSAAVFFLARGIRSRRAAYWLAASGLMFGFAVASRPHLGLIGMIAAAGLATFLAKSQGLAAALRSRPFAAFAVAWMLVGTAQAAYNYERFGDPFEFGFRYQLAGAGQNRIELAPRNVVPGLYYMLLARPQFSPVFPWMRIVFRFPFDSSERHPLPPLYFVEATAGALWIAPFLAAALLVPSSRRLAKCSKQACAAEAQTILWTAAAGSAAVLLFLMATHLATQRYEVDFLPLGVFAAAANLGIYLHGAPGSRRGALAAVATVLIGYSALANLALGIAGPYDDILKNRPLDYVRMASWFSPLREFRPAVNPRIAVGLTAAFTSVPPGSREPLITIGQSHYRHFLYAERAAGTLRLVSQSDVSKLVYEMPDPGARPVAIRLTYSPETHKLATQVNGQEAISEQVGMLVTAPAQVAIGENFSDFSISARRFTGRIGVVEKVVTD